MPALRNLIAPTILLAAALAVSSHGAALPLTDCGDYGNLPHLPADAACYGSPTNCVPNGYCFPFGFCIVYAEVGSVICWTLVP